MFKITTKTTKTKQKMSDSSSSLMIVAKNARIVTAFLYGLFVWPGGALNRNFAESPMTSTMGVISSGTFAIIASNFCSTPRFQPASDIIMALAFLYSLYENFRIKRLGCGNGSDPTDHRA